MRPSSLDSPPACSRASVDVIASASLPAGKLPCRSRFTVILVLSLLLVGSIVASSAWADDGSASLQITNVEVGIDGHYRVGRWTPIQVTVEGEASESVRLDIWVPDSDGNPTRQPSAAIALTGRGPHTLQTVFRTGRMDGVITIEVASAETVLVRRTIHADNEQDAGDVRIRPPHTLQTNMWVVLGPSSGYEQAAEIINKRDASSNQLDHRPVTLIPLESANELPTVADSLDSIDVLAVTGPIVWNDATDRSIVHWVEQGGHLVVSIGREKDWNSSPFSKWIPIRLLGESSLSDLSTLTTRLSRPDKFRGRSHQALRFEYDHGETIAGTRDGPLWVRLPLRLGRITLLGMSTGERPFVGWDTLPQLCEAMIDYQRPPKRNQRESGAAQLSRTGITDLSTQLAVAVDQYPELNLQSNWKTMGLVILYLVIIGPIDYLIVRYVLRRPQLTWVTFPLVVLVSAYSAVSSSKQSHATELTSNQVHLVDVDVATGMTRTSVWSSFVSPQTHRYAVEAEFPPLTQEAASTSDDTSPEATARLGWLGIPENGYRGMYRSGGLALARPSYAFAPGLTSIENVPVNLWSSSSHTATRIDREASPAAIFECQLSDASGQLEGTVINHLPVAIDDWFIAHQNLVYFPKNPDTKRTDSSIEAGATLELSRERYSPNILRNFLTGVTHVGRKPAKALEDNYTILSETYDPLSRDFYRIFRAVSFFRSCGGAEFTSLSNDQFSRMDLSPLLHLDRAVLFGRISQPTATVLVDGEPVEPVESETMIRVLLPID